MTLANIAAMRLHNRHLTHPDLQTPADVVRWFGAVQARSTPAVIAKVGKVLEKTLRGGRQCTRQELYMALNDAGITTGRQGTE